MDYDWSKIRVSSHQAMKIARLDRLRFNEAVNAGSYPCAPVGQRGKTRIFIGEEALICLCVFARLLEDGMAHAKAGRLACRLLTFFEENRAVGEPYSGNTVVHVRGESIDSTIFVAGERFDPEANRKDKMYIGVGRNLLSTVIDVANFREHVREEFAAMMEEQRHTLGSDEEDEG